MNLKENCTPAQESADKGTPRPEQPENHEELFEQKQPPWEPFDRENIDDNFKRKPATPEQKEKMDQRLIELGEVFENSGLNWHIDGAINISLLNGEYIGNHKDVDISVEEEGLSALETWLAEKGYGLFLSRTENETGNRTLRRVNYRDFRSSETENMQIVAINKSGEIRTDRSLNFIDVHVVKKNLDGQPLGEFGVVLPEEWAKSCPIEFKGKQLNLSHPGKVLYYKLHQGRKYDITDIQRLIDTGRVTKEDVDNVKNVFENEFSINIEIARKIFETIAKQLTPEMRADQIFEVALRQPKFKDSPDQAKELFRSFAQKIYESKDRSAEKMLDMAMIFFGSEEKNNQKREQIKTIERAVEDIEKIKQIRTELKQ